MFEYLDCTEICKCLLLLPRELEFACERLIYSMLLPEWNAYHGTSRCFMGGGREILLDSSPVHVYVYFVWVSREPNVGSCNDIGYIRALHEVSKLLRTYSSTGSTCRLHADIACDAWIVEIFSPPPRIPYTCTYMSQMKAMRRSRERKWFLQASPLLSRLEYLLICFPEVQAKLYIKKKRKRKRKRTRRQESLLEELLSIPRNETRVSCVVWSTDEESDVSNLTVSEKQTGVRFDCVKKIYNTDQGEVLAVDDFTLRLNEGEVTSLLGRNGAGKTTIMYVDEDNAIPISLRKYLDSSSATENRALWFQ